jgi:hypothetical protein
MGYLVNKLSSFANPRSKKPIGINQSRKIIPIDA